MPCKVYCARAEYRVKESAEDVAALIHDPTKNHSWPRIIELRRLSGRVVWLNPTHISSVEETPQHHTWFNSLDDAGGYQAGCSCGWSGAVRLIKTEARADAIEHEKPPASSMPGASA